MKKNLTTTNKSFLRRFVVFLSLLIAHCSLLIVLSCEQPFKAGLGPIIDLQDPVIVLDTPTAGSYIRGITTFTGRASDDYKVDTAWFNISNYPGLDLTDIAPEFTSIPPTEYKKIKIGDDIYYKITNTTGDSRNVNWSFRIDTKMMKYSVDERGDPLYEEDGFTRQTERVLPDGDLKIRLRVTDSVGKEAITDEIVFYIKNDIPEIVIDGPPIVPGTGDGELGGLYLNYDHVGPAPRPFKRTMETESLLVGRISDSEGLYRGDEGEIQLLDKDGEPVFKPNGEPEMVKVYPPQMRFWHVNLNGSAPEDDPLVFEAGVDPSEFDVPWRKIGGKDGIGEIIGGDGVKDIIFNYTLPDKSGQYYAFQVRAQSVDKVHSKAEYPKDYVNFDFENNPPTHPAVRENSYVLLRVLEPLEYPALELYQLQEIYGAPRSTGQGSDGTMKPRRGPPTDGSPNGLMLYNREIEITDQMEIDGNHRFFDKPIVSKNGAFTLRVKASHSADIASAKVYWEKEDKTEKGRFIWDPVERPHSDWAGIIPSLGNDYYTWGLNEWDGVGKTTSNTTVRSFVFTYYDDVFKGVSSGSSRDRIPDTGDFYPGIRGRSKVQKYKGSDYTVDEKGNPKKYNMDELPEEMAGNWDEIFMLDEGTYNIYVYATSMGGTRIATPLTLSITIDRGKPEIELNEIKGRASDIDEDLKRPVIVNGVIEPRFVLSDAQSIFRSGSVSYFDRPSGDPGYPGFYPEQIFLVVEETDKAKIDEHFKIGAYFNKAENIWPELPASPNGSMTINGVTIRKNGVIVNSTCRFKTSHIYHIPTVPSAENNAADGTDTLTDNTVYRVYVFARDSAFNVGSLSFPIKVVSKSDRPYLDLEGGSINVGVTEPDSAFDYKTGSTGDAASGKGFYVKNVVGGIEQPPLLRNIFNANSYVGLRLSDDDSLDLGAGSAPSGIKVTFVGTKVDMSTGTPKTVAESAEITVGDSDIKAAFPAQTVDDGVRTPVKEITGRIGQDILLNGLKGNSAYDSLFTGGKDAYSSLPDGIYRLGISVSDEQSAKLKMPGDPAPAHVVTVSTEKEPVDGTELEGKQWNKVILPPYTPNYFWIAVDNTPPAVDIFFTTSWLTADKKRALTAVEIENLKKNPAYVHTSFGPTNPSGMDISPSEGSILEGSVTDVNGPITLVKWTVRRVDGGKNTIESEWKTGDAVYTSAANTPWINTGSGPLTFTKYDDAERKWQYNFSYGLVMNNRGEGTYNFEVTFQDRFGRETLRTVTYTVDNEPPRVILTKPIETFSRTMLSNEELNPDGVYPTFPKTDENAELNKERLAVKVVNFSINVTDNFGVKGVRWWLLPSDKGATDIDFEGPAGTISGYDAYPSNFPGLTGVTGSAQGITYYSAGQGAYGELNLSNGTRQFTIAVDSERLQSTQATGNGQFRLYIIAKDAAGNISGTIRDAAGVVSGSDNFFQEVFFLQKEDAPYFGPLDNDNPNITPGYAYDGVLWPDDVDMDVRRGSPLVRGTIYENNGFFSNDGTTLAWPSSLIIWFSDSAASARNPGSDWKDKVKDNEDISGYTKKRIPEDIPPGDSMGIGRSGRNISLAIELAKLFPDAFKTDGEKRYIIKAIDSPVNKLWYNETTANESVTGIPMGVIDSSPPITSAQNEYVRVGNYRQFLFVYDANPPEVVIINPPKDGENRYGKNFADSDGFELEGYIFDKNLATVAYYYENLPKDHRNYMAALAAGYINNGKYTGPDKDRYYIEYYVDSNAAAKDMFVLWGTNLIISVDNTVKVTFKIPPSVVASPGGIIPQTTFDALAEGQHTLNIFATDKSGQEGAAWVSFTKDMKPPYITFTNLNANSRNYDKDNKSRVDKSWWTTMTTPAKQSLLLTNPDATRLPLTTISYDAGTGIPELRGTINDLVSNIKLVTGADPDVGSGDVNIDPSPFKYWIDSDGPGAPRYLALIDGKDTRSVRWTILLTSDGTTKGTPLPDGVHTIVLTAADTAGWEIPGPNDPDGRADERYMIAFRIDSKPPTASVNVDGALSGVYGDAARQGATMFEVTVKAEDANLDNVQFSIVRKAGIEDRYKNDPAYQQYLKDVTVIGPLTYNARSPNDTAWNGTWTYNPTTLTTDDEVELSGTYKVPSSLFTPSVPGGNYEFIVVANDTVPNKSEQFVWPFTYDKTAPVIKFTNPDDATKTATGSNNSLKPENLIDGPTKTDFDPNKIDFVIDGVPVTINRLTSENLRIMGNVTDDYSAIRQVQSRIEKWNWVTSGANTAGTWSQVQDWTDIRTDLSTNTQTTISWTKNLLGQNIGDWDLVTGQPAQTAQPIGGRDYANAEGLYRIRVRAKDASYTANGTNKDYTSNTWLATDIGNPDTSDYVYFYFDRGNPELEITKINDSETGLATYYTEPPDTGFVFEGTVKDNNRFAKVEVTFETGSTKITKYARLSNATGSLPAPTLNTGEATQNWIADGFTTGTALPDGKYKVTITAYDMTGRSSKVEMTFNLDTTKPQLKFTAPTKIVNKGYGEDSENPKPSDPARIGFANADNMVILAGPTSVITGTTEDKPKAGSPQGSESGIDQMWFHLGFIDGATYNAANPFPTKADIIALENKLAAAMPAGAIPARGAAESAIAYRNRVMNYLADHRATGDADPIGNAWFKLGGDEKPTGFVIDNPNIYDWRFEIPDYYRVPSGAAASGDIDLAAMVAGPNPIRPDLTPGNYPAGPTGTLHYPLEGLKLYTSTIRVKNRQYYVNPANQANSRQMVRAVSGSVYRLPLWVRLTDIAGNVEYYCHDIWIDAAGSIPSTSIESPSNGTRYNARGGAISVDGVARSNTSVYDVIFRVFADNKTETNLDGIQTDVNGVMQPNPAYKTIYGTSNQLTDRPYNHSTNNYGSFVRITGYDPAEATTVALLPVEYRPAAGATWNWQRASLTLQGGTGEPLIPWSIMLNSGDQIANLIKDYGFASGGGTTNDTIRVWLEVFVFNGAGSAIRSSIYPNDNLGTASYLAPGGTPPITNGGRLYGTDVAEGAMPYVRSFYLKTGAVDITHPNVGTREVRANTTPFTVPFIRDNVRWNAENAQNQKGGGYGGAGTETRSDKFAFSATLDPASGNANSLLGEVSYRVKIDDGAYGNWITAWARTPTNTDPTTLNSGGLRITRRTDTPPIGSSTRLRYYFDYLIDSKPGSPLAGYAGVPNGLNWSNTGGTITLQIRIRDNQTPPNEAEQTIQVGVDNFAPIGDEKSYGNSIVAGTNVTFQGRAYDFATAPAGQVMPKDSDFAPKKLKRVYAWFTKTYSDGKTYYVNMNTGVRGREVTQAAGGTGPATDAMTAFSGRGLNALITGGGASETTPTLIDITGAVGTPGQTYYVPRLGAQAKFNADFVRQIDQESGQPVNKMLWAPVQSQNYDVKWQFTLDSTKLPDGKITLHYIVEDEAGNASYYTQPDITVKNKYPQIDRLTLYTDNTGIGAVYTTHTGNNASTEYDLNDYRNKMFANYSDPSDYTAWNPAAAHDPDKDKLDKLGYLNSGFISKNKVIGFKVEASSGNRPLNFRLQYVTRQRIQLTKANLDQMVLDKNDSTKINLYTVAWYGDYSNAKWKALGVPADNPRLGTHFVFNPVNAEDASKAFDTTLAAGTAEVWKYTQVVSLKKGDITPPSQTDDDAVVVGPTGFDFSGTDFNASPSLGISELMGSHPDYGAGGDKTPDDPKKTAFFLIRVWDSVLPPATGTEAAVNNQLYDALVVGMNVYLDDKTPPTIRLYDLNPYAETAVVGNNVGTVPDSVFGGNIDNAELTIRNALDPRGIGENILRGGLFNTSSERELVIKSGHIEPRSTLLPSNAAFNGSPLHPKIKNPITKVYETYAADGFVEGDLETNTYTNNNGSTWVAVDRDLVSGKIILRGSAWDDQLIREIRVAIGTGTAPDNLYNVSNKTYTILELDASGSAATNPNYLTMKPIISGTTRVRAWAAEELHWKTGHTVEWAYVWDTEKDPAISGAPASAIKVWVAVIDKLGGGGAGLPSSSTEITADNVSAETFKNTLTVDIVPYITGIERDSKYATRRSLQGWYSFFQGEAGIAARGYNLGTSTTMTLYDGTTNYNLSPSVATVPEYNTSPLYGKYRVNFSIPTSAKSGKIILNSSVSVSGSTEALNHRSNDKQSWNKEAHYNTDGSNLWINKPYAHIWRTQQTTPGTIGTTGLTGQSNEAPLTYMGTTNSSATQGSIGLNHPGMALEYVGANAGRLHGAWAVYGYANVYYGHNNNASNHLITATPNEPYGTPDISIFEGGNGAPNNTTSIANIGFSYQADGDPQLHIKSRTAVGNGNAMLGSNTNPTQRWQNVRLSKARANTNDSETNVGRIYMTAWDARYDCLWFGTRDGTTNTTMTIDGGTGGVQRISDTGNGLAAAAKAGNFSAVDYDATGPIVAYYDQEHDTLRIALGLNATPGNGSNQWNRKYVLPPNHDLYRGSGRYVSIKVDRLNGIHLAFYNSTRSTVVYAYAASRSAEFTAYAVDDVIKGGTWTDISVRDNNATGAAAEILPFIVYGDNTRTGGYDGARMAYRSGTTTGIQFVRDRKDVANANITGWEAVSMPANYEINNDRLNIEAWPPTVRGGTLGNRPTGTDWDAAIGYASHMFRIGYFYYPKYKDGNY